MVERICKALGEYVHYNGVHVEYKCRKNQVFVSLVVTEEKVLEADHIRTLAESQMVNVQLFYANGGELTQVTISVCDKIDGEWELREGVKSIWMCDRDRAEKLMSDASDAFKDTYDVRAVDSFDYDMIMGEIAKAMKLVTVE